MGLDGQDMGLVGLGQKHRGVLHNQEVDDDLVHMDLVEGHVAKETGMGFDGIEAAADFGKLLRALVLEQ